MKSLTRGTGVRVFVLAVISFMLFGCASFFNAGTAMAATSTSPVHTSKASTTTTPSTSTLNPRFTLAAVPNHHGEEVWINGNTIYATATEANTEQYAPMFVKVSGVEMETFVPKAVADWYAKFPKELSLSDYSAGDFLYYTIQQFVPSTSHVHVGQTIVSRTLASAQLIY